MTSQGGGVGKRFRRSPGGVVSSMAKGDVYGLQRRMAAKRERDKAIRAKRVRKAGWISGIEAGRLSHSKVDSYSSMLLV